MYRAITLKALETGTRLEDRASLGKLLRDTTVGLDWRKGKLTVRLDGRDVSREIRTPKVSGFVSEVSAIPAVRRKMVALQRQAAAGRNVVCEGRDIGSVVFPDADLKVFLDCDIRARAGRRKKELAESGIGTSRGSVLANLRKRDRIDSGRAVAPLKRVPDAVLVDTSMLTIEEQVAVVCDLARRRQGRS